MCVVLITIALSTKQLPHFSPASHRHSDLTRTSNLFTLSPFLTPSRSSYLIPSCSSLIGVCVSVCVCDFIDTLLMEKCPHDPPSVSGVPQQHSQHISHPKAALQHQNTFSHTHTPPVIHNCTDKIANLNTDSTELLPTHTHLYQRNSTSGG